MFQCSSASRKFLNRRHPRRCCNRRSVSVLFSEPKIPQFVYGVRHGRDYGCFSALQRAENSSMLLVEAFPGRVESFSALQRAENSSIVQPRRPASGAVRFQCSSASRKFLNHWKRSIVRLFRRVSVLFSEPKIPQSWLVWTVLLYRHVFQCSSASRKFLNSRQCLRVIISSTRFQCSSASRKFLNWPALRSCLPKLTVSVLFSEPKIPQFPLHHMAFLPSYPGFSALQRAENSSILLSHARAYPKATVSVLFSEPKIPQSRPSHLRPSIFPTAMITLRHS